jgi:hypothetical protein
MNHRFPNDAKSFPEWQRVHRAKLAAWLMGGGFPERVPLESRVVFTENRQTFTVRAIEYRSQSDRTNTALLALPKNATNVPLLVALHGHETAWGKTDIGAFTAPHDDDFCAYFVERGWAVLQPATMNHTLQHANWTLQGEWTWDALVALDYAMTVPEIDPSRVAVCGLSTGGQLAMNALALDDRVRAGVAGCILSTWHHYKTRLRIPPHCDCGIVGQLSPHLEQSDWAALIAPKPVQYQQGKLDPCFCPGVSPELLDPAWNTGVMPQTEYDAMFAEVQRAYRLAGAPASVETRIHKNGHNVDNAAAFEFLSAARPFRGDGTV